MDIHENEDQLDEIVPVSKDAQVPDENMEEVLEVSQVGEVLQDAPPADIAEEEESIEASEDDPEEESILETEEEESIEDDEVVLEAELPLEVEEDLSSPEVD